MNISFGFGKEKVDVTLPDEKVSAVLRPNQAKIDLRGEAEVARSMKKPIGSERLSKIVKPGEKIVIITSDITRPIPSYKVLPSVLEELAIAGIPDEDITIVFALGSHGGHTEERMRYMVGDAIYERIHCVDSDMNDYIHLGTTAHGTPVDIFTPVAKADRKICLGNIEYHYFAGYSGGAKAIMPGVSTRAAIQSNHSAMVRPEACAGRLEGNPVREDIEESGRILGIDYIVNVVLDEKKEIIRCFSGDSVKAHRAGCDFLDSFYKIEVNEKADIVIVSAGGFPKDINMYQAQKALDNARHAVKKGGIIVWIASCLEGLGERHFEEWMTGHEKASDMISHIREEFILGGHKAAAIAMVLENARIFLVSDLEPDFVSSVFLEPYHDIQEAIDAAIAASPADAQIIAMPYGGSTLPKVLHP
ncbi:MAG TPA: nickel-dependent lactate racemase [Bacillota bacterium]|mgnify:CR=1 FL=1|nr:nickel-dependent lactate racemase [Bacillota bacterium]HPE37999.1 nickel-dependent lactate racemase [Bacillota bacterium]